MVLVKRKIMIWYYGGDVDDVDVDDDDDDYDEDNDDHDNYNINNYYNDQNNKNNNDNPKNNHTKMMITINRWWHWQQKWLCWSMSQSLSVK